MPSGYEGSYVNPETGASVDIQSLYPRVFAVRYDWRNPASRQVQTSIACVSSFDRHHARERISRRSDTLRIHSVDLLAELEPIANA